jgi:hypothetical protein
MIIMMRSTSISKRATLITFWSTLDWEEMIQRKSATRIIASLTRMLRTGRGLKACSKLKSLQTVSKAIKTLTECSPNPSTASCLRI